MQTLDVALGHEEGKTLVDMLADTQAEVDANTLTGSVGDVNAEALVFSCMKRLQMRRQRQLELTG